MKKQQKRSSAEVIYSFGETELSYSFAYGASVHRTVADYFEITPARKFVSQRDWSTFRIGALVSVLGLTALAAQTYLAGSPALAMLWLTPGFIFLALFAFRPDHFRIFQAAGDPVWILEDGKSQGIVAEIEVRRRNRLAEIYGPLNLCNEPRLEIAKIEWLVLESVITRDEADRQIAQVEASVAEKAARADMSANVTQIFAREALAV